MGRKLFTFFILIVLFALFITSGCQSTGSEGQHASVTQHAPVADGNARTIVKMYGGVPHVMKQQACVAEQ